MLNNLPGCIWIIVEQESVLPCMTHDNLHLVKEW